jgi:iron complex transport system substrate-binding protein
MTRRFPLRLLATAALAAVTLTGCAATTGAATGTTTASDAAADAIWPRTVEVGDRTVQVTAEPVRIAALSTEVGDLALELVGPDRLVAVSEGSATPGTGNQLELAEQVATHVSVTQNPDPEQILALEPDLVLLTGRHDDEASLIESLDSAGVPMAAFDSSAFGDPESVATSLEQLGELLGADAKAAELASSVRDEASAVTDAVADVEERPSVLVLMSRGGQQLIMGAQTSTTNLVELAGGDSVASEHGWNQAVAADPELIVDANPDVILVQDFHGAGLDPFTELLENPALADVTAIADDHVELVDAATTSGTAGSRIGEGLAEIAGLLHPELFA